MKKVLLLIISLLALTTLPAQNYRDTITQQLQDLAKNSDLPGFSVALVSKDRLLYKNGFGFADVDSQSPYTDQSLHNIGSISKTFIAFALMKLVEEQKIDLDESINKYLPFKIQHPQFPNTPMTIRQLACHTSGLTDGKDDMLIEYSYLLSEPTNFKPEDLPDEYFEYYEIYNRNKAMSMAQFLRHIYHPEGQWYAESNFTDTAPGTQYQYTNAGATLLAYIIEQVAEESFDQYIQSLVLDPLQMNQSTWQLQQADSKLLASLYLSNGQQVPHYQLITYPDGGLITNASDFGKYLMEMIKGLAGESKLLSQDSYREMMSNQLIEAHFPNAKFETSKGFMWNVNKEGDNIGANGADPGVLSYTLFTTQGNIGLYIMANTSLYGNEQLEKDFFSIRRILFKYVGKLMK
ncbi:MAG: serine hydrolase domain-containing protein [Bacteroidota bacterium]